MNPLLDCPELELRLVAGEGRLPALPGSLVARLDPERRFRWCAARARYGLPTEELILFLRSFVAVAGAGRALEIGAGQGDLGRLLGIRMTDAGRQHEHQRSYDLIGQAATDPPADVERLDAQKAIAKYRPNVVIGSWITQLYRDGDSERDIGSSVVGVDEEWILRSGVTYVHIGNRGVHKDKRIRCRPHYEVAAPWIGSRSMDQTANVIWIWDGCGGAS